MTKKTILVADDDIAILEALSLILEDAGYNVISSINGESLFKLNGNKPDLLLLDIWMSGVDGRDICKYLKKQNETKDIPIILVSANRETEKIAKEAGANDFILKPFELEDLLNKVNLYTNQQI